MEGLGTGNLGKIPERIRTFLDNVPDIDVDTLQTLHRARLARKADVLSQVSQPNLPDSDWDIDINDERYLIGLCVEAYANSQEVQAVDDPRDIANFSVYRQLRQMFVNGPVDLRFATLGEGSKIFCAESVGIDTVNMINMFGANCNRFKMTANQSKYPCICLLSYADVIRCGFSGLPSETNFKNLVIHGNHLGQICNSTFEYCSFDDVESSHDVNDGGNYFKKCQVKRLEIDSPLKSFTKESLTECEVGKVEIMKDDVDGTELSLLHLEGREGVDFEFNPASKGVVFWDSATAFRTLKMVFQGSVEGEVNMAIVPFGREDTTLKFTHKNEIYPGFRRVLNTLGLMLEYLGSNRCLSEYLEYESVKALIANGYRIIGPDRLGYAVELNERGKAVVKVETKEDEYKNANRARVLWLRFLRRGQ